MIEEIEYIDTPIELDKIKKIEDYIFEIDPLMITMSCNHILLSLKEIELYLTNLK